MFLFVCELRNFCHFKDINRGFNVQGIVKPSSVFVCVWFKLFSMNNYDGVPRAIAPDRKASVMSVKTCISLFHTGAVANDT